MPIANARASGRGKIPKILMNGHAAAYSNFRRMGKRDRITQKSSLSKGLPEGYFAASIAHFASVERNAFAGAGGSIAPVSAAFGVTMCP
jgi:hypothetical protein